MYVTVSPEKLELSPGTVVLSSGSWQEYLALYKQRGEDNSLPRIKYRSGEILLMAPLPVHGREADLLSAIVKVLLDAQNRNYEAFTPITMTLPEVSGIEPDYSFYIENWQAAVGKDVIDWQVEPAPDLVIEIDVTSYTDVNDYLPYRVQEVWLYRAKRPQPFKIYALENNTYVEQLSSSHFPDVDIFGIVEEMVRAAHEVGSSTALRSLRQKLQNPNP